MLRFHNATNDGISFFFNLSAVYKNVIFIDVTCLCIFRRTFILPICKDWDQFLQLFTSQVRFSFQYAPIYLRCGKPGDGVYNLSAVCIYRRNVFMYFPKRTIYFTMCRDWDKFLRPWQNGGGIFSSNVNAFVCYGKPRDVNLKFMSCL